MITIISTVLSIRRNEEQPVHHHHRHFVLAHPETKHIQLPRPYFRKCPEAEDMVLFSHHFESRRTQSPPLSIIIENSTFSAVLLGMQERRTYLLLTLVFQTAQEQETWPVDYSHFKVPQTEACARDLPFFFSHSPRWEAFHSFLLIF